MTRMTDLQETPATPPMDPRGDERVGFRIAGSLLIVLGWVFGIVVNLIVHATAGTGQYVLGPIRVTSHLGPYAWSIIGLGAFAGVLGTLILWISRMSPRGPVALPGYPY
ncbi:MAG: hypothetical protein WA761_08175 [Thermoplasmata archaeon]